MYMVMVAVHLPSMRARSLCGAPGVINCIIIASMAFAVHLAFLGEGGRGESQERQGEHGEQCQFAHGGVLSG
jgi:hypothetical protein